MGYWVGHHSESADKVYSPEKKKVFKIGVAHVEDGQGLDDPITDPTYTNRVPTPEIEIPETMEISDNEDDNIEDGDNEEPEQEDEDAADADKDRLNQEPSPQQGEPLQQQGEPSQQQGEPSPQQGEPSPQQRELLPQYNFSMDQDADADPRNNGDITDSEDDDESNTEPVHSKFFGGLTTQHKGGQDQDNDHISSSDDTDDEVHQKQPSALPKKDLY